MSTNAGFLLLFIRSILLGNNTHSVFRPLDPAVIFLAEIHDTNGDAALHNLAGYREVSFDVPSDDRPARRFTLWCVMAAELRQDPWACGLHFADVTK